jgi:predicted RNA binding protein YcfA (HicA-like mRNA interferase family)
MNRIPELTGKHVVQALERAGWNVKSQKGSHMKLVREGAAHFLIVPTHSHASMPRGTLFNIIRDSGIPPESFHTYL